MHEITLSNLRNQGVATLIIDNNSVYAWSRSTQSRIVISDHDNTSAKFEDVFLALNKTSLNFLLVHFRNMKITSDIIKRLDAGFKSLSEVSKVDIQIEDSSELRSEANMRLLSALSHLKGLTQLQLPGLEDNQQYFETLKKLLLDKGSQENTFKFTFRFTSKNMADVLNLLQELEKSPNFYKIHYLANMSETEVNSETCQKINGTANNLARKIKNKPLSDKLRALLTENSETSNRNNEDVNFLLAGIQNLLLQYDARKSEGQTNSPIASSSQNENNSGKPTAILGNSAP